MRDEWEKVTLGDLMTFKNGLNFTQDSNGKEYNFLGVGCFKSKNSIKNASELETVYISNPVDKDYLLKKDDLVFVRSNGSKELVGRCVLIENDISNATYSGFCIKGVLKSEKTTSKYILKNIEAGFLKEKLKHENRGTNISNLNQEILNSLEIKLPTLNEQDKIIETLNVWDSAIEKTEKLIEKKEALLNWYAKRVLISGKPSKVLFSDLFKLSSEKNTLNQSYPALSVTKDGVVFQEEYFNKRVASDDTRSYLIARRNTFVFSGLNFWMGSVDLQTLTDVGIISPAYKVFTINSDLISFEYAHFLIRSNYMKKLLMDSSIVGASIVRRNLDMNNLLNSVIELPELDQQAKIVEQLSLIQKDIGLNKKLLNQYKLQKQGLMQKLLTGEWRIK